MAGLRAMSGEELVQGSEAWLKFRCGKVTASRICDVIATVKSGGYGASRASYLAELLCERITGLPTERFVSEAMLNGTKLEPEARIAYSFYRDCDVMQVGFVGHPTIPMAGCSPDGCIGNDGLVEIKAPQRPAHSELLRTEKIPLKYFHQMQFQMAVTGRQYCDFASYNVSFPEAMSLFVIRVHRDQKAINVLEHEVRLFLRDLDAEEKFLRNKFLKDEL